MVEDANILPPIVELFLHAGDSRTMNARLFGNVGVGLVRFLAVSEQAKRDGTAGYQLLRSQLLATPLFLWM